MSDTFDPGRAEELARQFAEDDEAIASGPFSITESRHQGRAVYTVLDGNGFWFTDHDADSDGAEAIARLRNNARSAASMLRAAVAEVERLKTGSSKDLAMQVWFVARGANGAGQFVGDFEREMKCRDDFEAFWRDPHGYYKATGTDWGTQMAHQDERNRLAARVAELEKLAGEACDIAERLNGDMGDDEALGDDSARIRELRRAIEGGVP